jgi:hypothetical protein
MTEEIFVGATRRNRNADAGCCINGEHHGPPAPGLIRCPWCVQVHRVGSARALELAANDPANPQPFAGYRAKRPGGG